MDDSSLETLIAIYFSSKAFYDWRRYLLNKSKQDIPKTALLNNLLNNMVNSGTEQAFLDNLQRTFDQIKNLTKDFISMLLKRSITLLETLDSNTSNLDKKRRLIEISIDSLLALSQDEKISIKLIFLDKTQDEITEQILNYIDAKLTQNDVENPFGYTENIDEKTQKLIDLYNILLTSASQKIDLSAFNSDYWTGMSIVALALQPTMWDSLKQFYNTMLSLKVPKDFRLTAKSYLTIVIQFNHLFDRDGLLTQKRFGPFPSLIKELYTYIIRNNIKDIISDKTEACTLINQLQLFPETLKHVTEKLWEKYEYDLLACLENTSILTNFINAASDNSRKKLLYVLLKQIIQNYQIKNLQNTMQTYTNDTILQSKQLLIQDILKKININVDTLVTEINANVIEPYNKDNPEEQLPSFTKEQIEHFIIDQPIQKIKSDLKKKQQNKSILRKYALQALGIGGILSVGIMLYYRKALYQKLFGK